MNKVLIYMLMITFFSKNCYSQKEGDVWPIGLSNICKINFLPNIAIDTLCPDFTTYYPRGGASICDSSGHVLFFSNGIVVYNADCSIMQDASNFNPPAFNLQYQQGSNLFQDNIALPKKNGTYYLFSYVQSDSNTINSAPWDMILYHTIDMTENSGLGRMTSKGNIVLKDSSLNGSEFTACKHANGRDWWVIKSGISIDKYYKFLVTPDTVIGPFTQLVGLDTVNYAITPLGQAVFAQNGSKYARTSPNGKLIVLDFDRCSGEFMPDRKLWVVADSASGLGSGGLGLSFSPSGRFIYINTWDQIYQYDLEEADSALAMVLIADIDTGSFAGYTNQYLAPDGRIYIDNYHGTSNYLSYISNPDVKGVGCNFCQACLYIPNVGAKGIQNKINFRVGREVGSACDTIYNDLPKLEAQQKPFIHLQPNPSNNEVMINYLQPGNEPAILHVNNSIGQEIYRQQLPPNNTNYTLNTSLFSEGIYLVTLSTATQQITGRLSIVH